MYIYIHLIEYPIAYAIPERIPSIMPSIYHIEYLIEYHVGCPIEFPAEYLIKDALYIPYRITSEIPYKIPRYRREYPVYTIPSVFPIGFSSNIL